MTDDIFRHEGESFKVKEFWAHPHKKLTDKTAYTRITEIVVCTICGAMVAELGSYITHTDGYDQDTYNYGTVHSGQELHEEYHRKRGDIE